ncbi:hypothetical protein AFK68_02530 [Hydrocoleum sp. CS-953]|nr:hypothetical protein AFK68_02530 [Hydrocoleum sp. CS-953]
MRIDLIFNFWRILLDISEQDSRLFAHNRKQGNIITAKVRKMIFFELLLVLLFLLKKEQVYFLKISIVRYKEGRINKV